jgi:hypothetical protein
MRVAASPHVGLIGLIADPHVVVEQVQAQSALATGTLLT